MILRILSVVVALGLACASARAELGDVLQSFPAPGFYTNGLTWDGSRLWASNIADAAHPDNIWYRIYEIDPATGSVVSSFSTSPSFYHGLAWDGTGIWGAHNWTVFTKLTTTGGIVTNIPSPVLFTYGAAWDPVEGVLWTSVFQSKNSLIKIDPANGDILHRIYPAESAATSGWADVAWDGENIWHTNSTDETVYKIDPVTGAILDSFLAPVDGCQGLTCDDSSLWLSSPQFDMIFRVDKGIAVDAPNVIHKPSRMTAYPNPSRGAVFLTVDGLPGATYDLDVFNVAGRLVRQLRSDRAVTGLQHLQWDGVDAIGRPVPAGTYFLRLQIDGTAETRRITLLR